MEYTYPVEKWWDIVTLPFKTVYTVFKITVTKLVCANSYNLQYTIRNFYLWFLNKTGFKGPRTVSYSICPNFESLWLG